MQSLTFDPYHFRAGRQAETVTLLPLESYTCKKKQPRKALGKTASKASGKKIAADIKKKGVGLSAPKTLSPALAAICGGKTMPRTEVRS